jgi:hypothetical protein
MIFKGMLQAAARQTGRVAGPARPLGAASGTSCALPKT